MRYYGTNTITDWPQRLIDQPDWHWQRQLRPRLAGLTDEEYFWEPLVGCWNIRPRGESTAPIQAGSGAFTIDFAFPSQSRHSNDDRLAAGPHHCGRARCTGIAPSPRHRQLHQAPGEQFVASAQ